MSDLAALADEVRRLRTMIEHRSHATVYERTAWQHDLGQHDGSALPYAYCPRCEMEHPQGAYPRLLDAAARLVELLEDPSLPDTEDVQVVALSDLDPALAAFREAVAGAAKAPQHTPWLGRNGDGT